MLYFKICVRNQSGGERLSTLDVVDYRPEWEKMFQEEAKKIQKILGKNCIAIYHIGSTSVKGLAAKPVIDFMPVVRDISLVDAHDPEFRELGYDCRGEFGIPMTMTATAMEKKLI